MSSLNGVSIRNLKQFKGHEEEPLCQGTVYLNNQKLGFWSEDAHGGLEGNFSFRSDLLTPAMKQYKSSLKGSNHLDYISISTFMYCVTVVKEVEIEFKQQLKLGYKAIYFLWDLESGLYKLVGGTSPSDFTPDLIQKVKNRFFKIYDITETRFTKGFVITSVDDLDFVIGTPLAENKANSKKTMPKKVDKPVEKTVSSKSQEPNFSVRFCAVPDGKGIRIMDTFTHKDVIVTPSAANECLKAIKQLFE